MTPPEPEALAGDLSDEVLFRILRVLGLATHDDRAAAVGLSRRRWQETEHHPPMRRRDPWLARFTHGPPRAGAVPPDTPIAPEPPHDDPAIAFAHLADLPEIGHRWTPRAPPCP